MATPRTISSDVTLADVIDAPADFVETAEIAEAGMWEAA